MKDYRAITERIARLAFCNSYQLSDRWVVAFINEVSSIQSEAKALCGFYAKFHVGRRILLHDLYLGDVIGTITAVDAEKEAIYVTVPNGDDPPTIACRCVCDLAYKFLDAYGNREVDL